MSEYFNWGRYYNFERPIVAKFGGTSNATGERVVANVEIMRADPRRKYMVNSAPGKYPGADIPNKSKITDLLIMCDEQVRGGKPFDEAFATIDKRFREIAGVLQVTTVDQYLKRLEMGITEGNTDWTLAQGEWIQGMLVSDYTGWPFRDPVDFMKLRNNGEISPMTYEVIKDQLLEDTIYVIPGFYGADDQGNIKVFKRGGGDITGAIVARGVDAGLYENWTDVDGLSAGDPRVVGAFKKLPEVSRKEVRELGYRGANVFHGDAVLPLEGTDIPIHLRNSLKPSQSGTMILHKRQSSPDEGPIGIAGKPGFRSFTIEKPGMNNEEAIGKRIFTILSEYGIQYDHDITGIDYTSIIIDDEQFKKNGHQVKEAMKRIQSDIQAETISEDTGLGLVCLVGQNLPYVRGIKAAAINVLEANGIDVLGLSSPIKGRSMTFAVEGRQANRAVKIIYEALFNK